MPTSSPRAEDVWDVIAADAEAESPLWRAALRSPDDREREPVFSPLGDARFALGLETIYEGYLLHYGRSRLFDPADGDIALLLGDYLYAHGLVRVSTLRDVDAVADLAALVSLCAQLRAEELPGDGIVWAATAALLGTGKLEEPRTSLAAGGDAAPLERLARDAVGSDALARALDRHRRRVVRVPRA